MTKTRLSPVLALALAALSTIGCTTSDDVAVQADVAENSDPAIHAMVIGINDYGGSEDLEGAVNDAKLMAELMQDLGASTLVSLIDREATREAIFAGWRQLLAKSRPGDLLVVTYAGHGDQMPERVQGSEEDGLDEFFKLAGYADDPSEAILDDEWGRLFEGAKDRRILFLADSCHSATASRGGGIDAYAHQGRASRLGPKPLFAEVDWDEAIPDAQPHVIRLSAVKDQYKIPEITAFGMRHGALTVAFDLAVRGGADTDRDGTVTVPELFAAVSRIAKLLTDDNAAPVLEAADSGSLFRSLPRKELPAVAGKVAVVNPVSPAPVLDGLTIVDRDEADFLWDQTAQVVIREADGSGAVVAEQVSSVADVRGEIKRWTVRDKLAKLPEARLGLSMRVNPAEPAARPCTSDGIQCRRGDHVAFTWTRDPPAGFVHLIALSAKGQMSLLGSGSAASVSRNCSCVDTPYGVDHVVLLVTPERLRFRLDERDVGTLDEDNVRELERAARLPGATADWLALYTTEGPGQCPNPRTTTRCPWGSD
jgi:hypothetical protein